MSVIHNVFYRVVWENYRTEKKPKAPPGGWVHAAQTKLAPEFHWQAEPIPGTPRARLGDISMTIRMVDVPAGVTGLDPSVEYCWVADWVDQESEFGNELLNHEQGHYEIAAFLFADLFNEVYDQFIRAQNPRTFGTKKELDDTMEGLTKRTVDQIEKANKKYDDECGYVGSPNAKAAQQKWDGYFKWGHVNPLSVILKEKKII